MVFVTPASDKEQAVYHLFNLFPVSGICKWIEVIVF